MSLQSCTRNGSGDFCTISKPIYFHAADKLTPDTEKAIISHDETWEKLCK